MSLTGLIRAAPILIAKEVLTSGELLKSMLIRTDSTSTAIQIVQILTTIAAEAVVVL